MRLLITSATVAEWMPAFVDINPLYTGKSRRLKVQFHQSGVGMLATSVNLMRVIADEKPDLVLQAGIAGCFDTKAPLGKVVVVASESLADMGVEEGGKWKDLFDLKLEKSSYHPFEKRKLPNPWLEQFNLLELPEVDAVTVNEISTRKERIRQICRKYDPYTESMEGAALHYICRETNTPFLQIRALSNYIGERDKANWKIREALGSLNKTLLAFVDKAHEMR